MTISMERITEELDILEEEYDIKIKALQKKYNKKMAKIAKLYFQEYVKPFCEKHKCSFGGNMLTQSDSMCSWFSIDTNIWNINNTQNNMELEELEEILNIHMLSSCLFGSIMPNYEVNHK